MKSSTAFCILAALSMCLLRVKAGPIHQEWIEQDRAFVREVKATLRNNPRHADKVLFWFPVERDDLGFGYALTDRYVGKGYLGFRCQMLYFQDELVSFRVTPSVGYEKRVLPVYVDMLHDLCEANPDGTFEPFSYNPAVATSALPGGDTDIQMSEKVQWLCSPFSGIRYGTRGGYAGGYLENRRAYLAVADEIDSGVCLRLLYSINPATRLTAYEHYRRHETECSTVKDQVEARIRQVLRECPRIETMMGCIVREEESSKVLQTILGERPEENPWVEPDGTANRSQPIRAETNRTSVAAGSDR